MEYIKKLHAKSIGVFNSLDIEFSPKNNIIVGPNSSGKTSILKLLSFCFSMNGFDDTRFRIGAALNAEFVSKGKNLSAGAKDLVNIDQEYRKTKIERWNKVLPEGFFPYEDIPFNLFAIGAYRYFEYNRINGMQREEKGLTRRKFYLQNNVNSLTRPSLPAIKQWMINRYFIIEKDWANIESRNWQNLITYLPKIVSRDQKFKFLKIERDLEPVFEFNGNSCYLEELSGGFKSILSIIFGLIDWCEGINESEGGDISKATGTVLIDEIEAHLHPEWQAKILHHLNSLFPNLQFIITTHSPHVISNAGVNEIIRIPNHSGTVNVKPLQQDFNYWETKDILSDLMGYNINGDNKVSLVLGKLDKALDAKKLDEFNVSLDELKTMLHSNDPIIKVYEINKSKIFLND